MPLMLHQVTMPYVTGLPADVSVNTFWTSGGTDPEAQAATAFAALVNFYTEPQSTGDTVGYFLSAYISREDNVCSVRSYDWTDPEPRAPRHVGTFTLPTAGNLTSLPFEVALCLTFQGENASGINQQRRRGRIYLGPLGGGSVVMGSNVPPAPSATFMTTVADAAEGLSAALSAPAAQWVVHSRVSSNNAPVVGGWIDNEFDTQRRRQVRATARTVWSAVT